MANGVSGGASVPSQLHPKPSLDPHPKKQGEGKGSLKGSSPITK